MHQTRIVFGVGAGGAGATAKFLFGSGEFAVRALGILEGLMISRRLEGFEDAKTPNP